MVKPAKGLHRLFQRVFACMAEGGVTNIMRQAKRLGQIFIEPQCARDCAAYLGNLQTVGQADAIMIAIGGNEDLRFVPQSPESDGMDDAITITLKDIAWAAQNQIRFGVMPASAGVGTTGIRSAVGHG
jgi:hypothetical protein